MILGTSIFILQLVAGACFGIALADIGPNETQVLLAGIGAVVSLVNTFLLGRARRERKQHEAQVTKAIGEHGLVAMVPEQVVKDIAGEPAHDRRAGDQAP